MNASARRPTLWLLPTFALLLALGHAAPPAGAQNVRRERSGFGSTRRQGDNAAERLNRADWPRIAEGDAGTQVHVTFDLRNADVILMTGRDFGQQTLLDEARRVAVGIGRPRADYILFTGTKTVNADIELNKYLVQPDRKHTSSDLDLSALASALSASSLPRPIVLFVRADEADAAALTAPGSTRRLGEQTFFGLNEVPAGAHLHFAASVPWYASLVAIGLAGMLLSVMIMAVTTPWRVARKRAERAQNPQPAAPPSPEEVQQRYNKQKPLWMVMGLLPLCFALAGLFGNPKTLMSAVVYSLPFDPDPQTFFLFPIAMIGLTLLSTAACWLWERRRARLTGRPLALPADPDAPPGWTQRWFLVVMGAMMLPMMLLPLLLFNGTLTRLPWLRFVPFVMLGFMAVAFMVGGWLAARATRTTLAPDDPWRVMVDEVAAQAGVRVKHVVRVQSPSVNAYASIFGTVGLTAGLLRKMAPDEVRIVIAHEIGHLRGGHTRRGFAVSLATLAAIWALWWFGLRAARPHLSGTAYALLNGPLIGFFLVPFLMNLLLGRGRRQREAAADRFAVEVIGDQELVIATLTKLHTLNASPHQLRPSDEILSSHPSLVHRIEAIRSAQSQGTAKTGSQE